MNKIVVALGGFNDKAVEANGIYCCFVRPVCRAFGEEEDSEPVEEAVEESIFITYSCGNLVFENDYPVSEVLAQRQTLNCKPQIENAYYNLKERALKLPDICIHCGEGGSNDFLFGQAELEAKGKTEGKRCYLICTLCLGKGKPYMKYQKKRRIKQRRERKRSQTKLR